MSVEAVERCCAAAEADGGQLVALRAATYLQVKDGRVTRIE